MADISCFENFATHQTILADRFFLLGCIMIRSIVLAAAAVVSVSAMAADLGVKKPSPLQPSRRLVRKPRACRRMPSASPPVRTLLISAPGARRSTTSMLPAARVAALMAIPVRCRSRVRSSPALRSALTSPTRSRASSRMWHRTPGHVARRRCRAEVQAAGRAPHGLGLTFAISPNVQAYNGWSFFGGNDYVFGNSYRLLADAELVKGRLFGALNIELFQAAYNNTLPASAISRRSISAAH